MGLEALGTFSERLTTQTSTQPAVQSVKTGSKSTQPAAQNVTTTSGTDVTTVVPLSVRPAAQPATQASLQTSDRDIAELIDIKALLADFPKSGAKQSLNMRVDAGTAQRIDELAKRHDTTKTAIVERAVSILAAVLQDSGRE